MIDHNTIYIGKRKVTCLDSIQHHAPADRCAYAPINGFGYVLAVFAPVFDRDGLWTCIGWILSEDLGYRSAKEWITANPDWEKKYGNLFHTAG